MNRMLCLSIEFWLGSGLLVLLMLAALLSPFIYPDDPLRIAAPPLLSPFENNNFPLGTDRLGRDVLAQLFYGARTSLMIGLAASFSAILVGSLIGVAAGFSGGLIDNILMRITEAFQTVPGFLLALALVSLFGPSIPMIVMAITLSSWTQAARLVRGQVLSLRERDFVASAKVIGMHPVEIGCKQILPHALAPVFALAPVIVAGAVLTEAALSFLGLGDPNRVTWGGMISEGRTVLRSMPSLSIVPGVALVLTVIGVYLTGEGFKRCD